LGEIFLGQRKYTVEILWRFRMEDCRQMVTPMVTNLKKVVTSDSNLVDTKVYRQWIGSLMYLVNTRPDICFVVNTLSQFVVEPRQVHWIVVKHVIRYLRGTVEYGLRYLGGDGVRLQRYLDSDWAESAVDRKSTSRCCFILGLAVITWSNRKQTSATLSLIEAEYITVSMASCEAIWLHKLLTCLCDQELEPTVI
jgi:hypothetical protein